MTTSYICNTNKYTTSATQTISLPLSLDVLPNQVSIENTDLLLKSKFHISLVPIQKIVEKYKINILDFDKSVLEDFCEYVNKNPVEFTGFLSEFRFVQQKELRTLVVMCEVANLDGFYNLINKKYNLAIETPRAHVTIYTSEPDQGIFLINSDDIEQMTKIVDVSSLSINPKAL